MSLAGQTTLRVVLYEGSGSETLAAEDRFAAISALLEKGFAVTRANGNGQPAPAQRNHLLVLGRFAGGQVPLVEDAASQVQLKVRDISGLDSSRIAETVEAVRAETGAARHTD